MIHLDYNVLKRAYLYVAIAGEDKVLVYDLDTVTGIAELQNEILFVGGPEILTIDPGKRFLFVGCNPRHYAEGVIPCDPKIYSCQIEWKTGNLIPINKITVNYGPVYLSTDSQTKFLFSAYYLDGKAAVHRINEMGEIGEATQWFDSGGGVHSIQIDPSNRYVFLPHVSIDKKNIDRWLPILSQNHILQSASNTILQFKFDNDRGILLQNDPFKLPGERGGGPRHLCFHPKQNVVYVTNEQGCTVTAYSFDITKGTLSPFQIISTLPPEGYDQYAICGSLRITHSGRFLFVLNRGYDSVACFTIDPLTCRLALIQLIPTETFPRELDLDLEDKFLFVVGHDSGRMASYRILADGKLKQLESRPVGRRPMWVLVASCDAHHV